MNSSGFGTGYREPTASTMNDSGNTSNLARETAVSENQVRSSINQYGGSTLSSSGPAGMYSTCNSCGGMGHSSVNCPSVMTSQGQTYGSSFGYRETPGASAGGECFKCHQIGHWAKDCPGSSNALPAYGSSNPTPGSSAGGECFQCLSNGPPAYRSYNSTPGRYGNVPKQHVGGF